MNLNFRNINFLLSCVYEDKKLIQNEIDRTFAGIKRRVFIRKSIPYILAKLNDKNTPLSEKNKALNDLYEIGGYAKPAIPALQKILKEDPHLTHSIKRVLANINSQKT